ncbi:MAG: hypothetical protein HFI68_05365 [Lachnospiraceae bacterium]|nr:hypothetical protein [Lachnospiraceae bacterium]
MAAATILLSLFFYFFPSQAVHSAHAIYDFANQLIRGDEPPPDQPSLQNTGSNQEVQQTSPSPAESLETTDIPMISLSSTQGDISYIGQSDSLTATDADYLVMLDTAMGAMLYYNQGDSRWGDYLYGGMDPMRQYGCGPTVAAMLINAFTPSSVTPIDIADWSAANGCYSPHGGSYHSIITKALTAHGLHVESAANADRDTAADLLRSGHVLVALVGKGTFSNEGHFIIITNILENGSVHIADSYNFENTKMEWDLGLVLAELKGSGDDGGPLWAVSY